MFPVPPAMARVDIVDEDGCNISGEKWMSSELDERESEWKMIIGKISGLRANVEEDYYLVQEAAPLLISHMFTRKPFNELGIRAR